MQMCIVKEIIEDCSQMGLRCIPMQGCVDVECVDVFECPAPPPVAIVDCQDQNVVNVLLTPVCTEMGQCDYEESYRVIQNCSEAELVCVEGECVRDE